MVKLGLLIRRRLRQGSITTEQGQSVLGVAGGDTIFGLDRHVEDVLIAAVNRWPTALLPVGIFAEGLEVTPLIVGRGADEPVRYWLLIDPIDGTRGLMYDKRSALFLAAAAPGEVKNPRLSSAVASVAVELPTSKQGYADTFLWAQGGQVEASRQDLRTGTATPLRISPSSAASADQGFGSVAAYFPKGKARAAALAEEIARRAGPNERQAEIFDDQFMSSGGQMVELLLGRDRFVIDLRPILQAGGQSAHPYDLALAPLAAAGGVILTAPDGTALDAPFDLTTPIAWCGYANAAIRAAVEPAVFEAVAASQTMTSEPRPPFSMEFIDAMET